MSNPLHQLAKETRHLRRAPSLGREPHKGGNHHVRLIRSPDSVVQFTQWQLKLGYTVTGMLPMTARRIPFCAARADF